MSFSPTPEQALIIEAIGQTSDSVMVQAYAGCAKTTTIELSAAGLKPQPCLALAFNVKIKEELAQKLPSFFEVKTMNGLGHSAWAKAIGKRLTLNDNKLGAIIRDAGKQLGVESMSTAEWHDVLQLINRARSTGLVPRKTNGKGLIPDEREEWENFADELMLSLQPWSIDVARRALELSIKLAYSGVIDFSDQIYMPTCFGGTFPRFPRVFCDEAQDLSPLNHLMLQRSASDLLAIVGDPKQAIYQFRGASSDSMPRIGELRPNWTRLPLATTFRCPKVVVGRQQTHALGYTAWHTNPDGEFHTWESWGPDSFKALQGFTAVLCRNNAPLIKLAFRLIRAGIGCHMLGRDIGKGLINLTKKIIEDLSVGLPTCVGLIQTWMDSQCAIARMKGDDSKISRVLDQGESLLAVIDSAKISDGNGLIRALEELFSKTTGKVTLATGHKAKGLEWTNVIHLDPFLIPSKFALRSFDAGNLAPLEQERNLLYVIETRTRHQLIEAWTEGYASGADL